ncbi:MAG TPA: aspartyl protease family protein [Candidatus Koribacter sp.]|jgi:tetratricopeptide (TPR) repeat protein
MRRLLAFTLLALPLAAQSPPADAAPDAALSAWRTYDFAQSEKLYHDAIAKNANAPEAQAGLIRSLLDEKKIPDARHAADAALKLLPDSAPVLAANADVLYREGDLAGANTDYEKSIELNPELARGWYGIARIAQIDSRYRTAIRVIERAHELDPDDPEIYEFWAFHLPRIDRRRALEHLIDHPGHMAPDHLSTLQSAVAWLITLGNRNSWELASTTDNAKIKLDRVIRNVGGYGPSSGHQTAVALQAVINDKKVRLMIDTGATGIVLSRGAASKAKVRQIYDTVSRGIGDEKDASGYLGWAHSLKIGPIEFHNVPLNVIDGHFPQDCDGLIGVNVFEHFLVTLDIQHSELALAPLPPLLDANKDSTGNYDRYIAPEMKDYLPVLRVGAHILVPTSVDDRPNRVFLLDTGAFDTQVDTKYVDPSKLTALVDIPIRGISGQVKDVLLASNVRIHFGPFVQDNFRMIALNMDKFSEGDGLGIKGILGFPLLSEFRLTFDYRDGLVNFDYLGKH